MVILSFAGTEISAKVVDWGELDSLNDKADDFMLYLGNCFCDNEQSVYALFMDKDDGNRYAVKL